MFKAGEQKNAPLWADTIKQIASYSDSVLNRLPGKKRKSGPMITDQRIKDHGACFSTVFHGFHRIFKVFQGFVQVFPICSMFPL